MLGGGERIQGQDVSWLDEKRDAGRVAAANVEVQADAANCRNSSQVRDANVVAALSIANVVKSSLGPVGLDKSKS